MFESSVRTLKALLPYSWRVHLGRYFRLSRSIFQRAKKRVLPGTTVFPHRLVFIAGLPKSGTTWLENLMLTIPGYEMLAWYDPNNRLIEHILDPVLLEHLPARGNFFIKTHVEARPEGVEALKRHGVPTIVMVRDLRDQCVSRFHHVLTDPNHRHHSFYTSGNRAEAFSHCVEVTVSYYADWCREWVRVANDNQGLFLIVRYEDMHADVKREFLRVLRHFDIALNTEAVDQIIEDVAKRTRKGSSLAERLTRGSTFRAGRVGDWRSYFSPSDVEYLKAKANDVLVSLGYEKDDKWTA